jgi:carboxylesterase
VWNRGVALVPATLSASREGEALAVAGRAALAYHGGKLLEARWFADDVAMENAFFGEPEPEVPGAASLDADFDARPRHPRRCARRRTTTRCSRSIRCTSRRASATSRASARRARHGQPREIRRLVARKGTSREDAMRALHRAREEAQGGRRRVVQDLALRGRNSC